MVNVMDINTKIKKAETDGQLIIGSKSVMTRVMQGTLENVIFANTCPKVLKEDISNAAKLSEIAFVDFSGDASDLGEICRKPFNISVLGIAKKNA